MRRAAVAGLIALAAAACASIGPKTTVQDRQGEVGGRVFEFATRGSEHVEEHGQWMVRLRGDALWIAYHKKGRTKEYGTFKLADKETRRLWKLVDAARLSGRRSAPGAAGAKYVFVYMRAGKLPTTVELDMRAALRDDALASLVRYVGRLIERYAGREAVLTPAGD